MGLWDAIGSDLVQAGVNIGGSLLTGGLSDLLGTGISSLISGVNATDPVETGKKLMDLTTQKQLQYAHDTQNSMAGTWGQDATNIARNKYSRSGATDALTQMGVSGNLGSIDNNLALQQLFRKEGQQRTGSILDAIRYGGGQNAASMASASRQLDDSSKTFGSMLQAKSQNDQKNLGALGNAAQLNMAGQQSFRQNRIDPYAVRHDQTNLSGIANQGLATAANTASQQATNNQFSMDSVLSNTLAARQGSADFMDELRKMMLMQNKGNETTGGGA